MAKLLGSRPGLPGSNPGSPIQKNFILYSKRCSNSFWGILIFYINLKVLLLLFVSSYLNETFIK